MEKLRASYEKAEEGSINYKQFKKIIQKELHLKTTDDFESIVNTAHQDRKSFGTIVKSLGFLKENLRKHVAFSPDLIRESTAARFHRYSKNVGTC